MPFDIKSFLSILANQKWYKGQIISVYEVPPQKARFASLTPPLPRKIESYLTAKDIQLYSHQAEVIRKVREGKNVVLTTATASGKSLAFILPVLEKFCYDKNATALFLYPMKALSYDQLKSLYDMEREMGLALNVAVYDGDTPKKERGRIRGQSRLILSNPHAFHQYLGWHRLWERFFRNLKFIVIDEAHWYRGIYGSNVALLIRRLRRILRYYGSDPQFILASATMADPIEHANKLVGKQFELVDDDGSAHGKKTYVLWDTGANPSRSEHQQATDLFAHCVASGMQTLCFTVSRKMAELTALWAGEKVPGIAPYRAGYLPEERRALEKDLKEGRLRGIASTNALELGVDIGGLDAVVISGWPGMVASFRQQSGRAGRSGQDALVIQIFFNGPLESFLLKNPSYIFANPSEQAIITLDNDYILKNHLQCAAEELPLEKKDEEWFGAGYIEAVKALIKEGSIHLVTDYIGIRQKAFRRSKKYAYNGKNAARKFNLSSFEDGEVKLICDGDVLEVLSRRQAIMEAHPGAIYLHQAEPYRVKEFNLDEGMIVVEPAKNNFYTTTLSRTDIMVNKVTRVEKHGRYNLYLGRVSVSEQIYGYMLKTYDKVISHYDLDGIPPVKIDTVATWIQIMDLKGIPGDLEGGLHAAEHALIAVTPLLAMCDRWDVGGVSIINGYGGKPAIYIYDGFPGGIGIAERLYSHFGDLAKRAYELVKECDCKDGCPRCVMSYKCGNNNEPLDKHCSIKILELIAGKN